MAHKPAFGDLSVDILGFITNNNSNSNSNNNSVYGRLYHQGLCWFVSKSLIGTRGIKHYLKKITINEPSFLANST